MKNKLKLEIDDILNEESLNELTGYFVTLTFIDYSGKEAKENKYVSYNMLDESSLNEQFNSLEELTSLESDTLNHDDDLMLEDIDLELDEQEHVTEQKELTKQNKVLH